MRAQLGLSLERAKAIMHTIAGFAQKMFLFRNNSGLNLASAITFFLDELPTYEFAELEFDVSRPFQSVGFRHVDHPGLFLLSRGNALESSISLKPPSLFPEDHRCKLENSSKTHGCMSSQVTLRPLAVFLCLPCFSVSSLLLSALTF